MTLPKLNNFVFFGTDEFAVTVLGELARSNCAPASIVTTPDTPRGRGRILTPPPVKLWAEKNHIPFRQPSNPRSDLEASLRSDLNNSYTLFLVASYGKIIPPEILTLPKHGVLNIHPSLLPKYRGPTPIQNAILAGEEETGVTILLIDEQIDHGPILKTQNVKLKTQNFIELRDQLAKLGAQLFIEILPDWLADKIKPEPQDHSQATFTKKIKKEDGLIDLADNPLLNYRKFLAFTPWPGIYFFTRRRGQKIRVIITAAHLAAGQFIIDRVKPESRDEMSWINFESWIKS